MPWLWGLNFSEKAKFDDRLDLAFADNRQHDYVQGRMPSLMRFGCITVDVEENDFVSFSNAH